MSKKNESTTIAQDEEEEEETTQELPSHLRGLLFPDEIITLSKNLKNLFNEKVLPTLEQLSSTSSTTKTKQDSASSAVAPQRRNRGGGGDDNNNNNNINVADLQLPSISIVSLRREQTKLQETFQSVIQPLARDVVTWEENVVRRIRSVFEKLDWKLEQKLKEISRKTKTSTKKRQQEQEQNNKDSSSSSSVVIEKEKEQVKSEFENEKNELQEYFEEGCKIVEKIRKEEYLIKLEKLAKERGFELRFYSDCLANGIEIPSS